MRRRRFLGSSLAALSVGALGSGRAGASTAVAYDPLGTVSLFGAKEAVVGADGRTAYLALTDGYATVDISTTERPTVLHEERNLLPGEENGPLGQIYDVKVDSDRLAVFGPANGGALRGVVLYDVADPASPELLTFYETAFPIHNGYFHEGYLYLTGNGAEGNPLVVLEVTGDEVSEVGRWGLHERDERWLDVAGFLRTLHDVVVRDDVAYCCYWDAGTYLLDVSDPASPSYLGHTETYTLEDLLAVPDDQVTRFGIEPAGNSHYVALTDDGTTMAVGRESWDWELGDEEGGPSGIDLYDVSDPSAITDLASIAPPVSGDNTYQGGTWTTAHNFDIAEGRLYSSWYQGGVKIHDISDPVAPAELTWWRRPTETRFWTAQRVPGRDVFVASDMGLDGDGDPGLYLFPDEAGEMADPPALSPTPTPEPTPTPTPTESPTPSPSPSPTRSPTPTPSPTESPTPTPSTSVMPGFGWVAAVAGGALAAWRLREREEE